MDKLLLGQALPNSSDDFPWYVAQTKLRQESTAVINLQRQGYKTYLPMLTSWKKRSGQWCQVQEVCFPHYVFCSPGRPHQGIGPVRSTQGVSSLVTFGQTPATIGCDVLEALNRYEQVRAQQTTANPLAVGDVVRVETGPLAGLTGIVSANGIERIAVMLSLLGREKSVKIPMNALLRVS